MGNVLTNGVPPELRSKFKEHHQDQVFRYIDNGMIKGEDVESLLREVADIDPSRVNKLYKSARKTAETANDRETILEPIHQFGSLSTASEAEKASWYSTGLTAVKHGKVAAVVLAGGQGTRLGFDGPKGMYDVGLPSGKSLFQLQAERLRRVRALAESNNHETGKHGHLRGTAKAGHKIHAGGHGRRHGDTAGNKGDNHHEHDGQVMEHERGDNVAEGSSDHDHDHHGHHDRKHRPGGESKDASGHKGIPWYIMTSPINDEPTRRYFADNDYFGIPNDDIFFFCQGTLPCLSNDGKILLERANKVAVAPDGNGGIYPALARSGALKDMHRRGIKHLHVFSIDNALVKVVDPYFIGYCIENHADCGNKSVWKTDPGEKVGVVAKRDGKPCVVEYSEMDKESCDRRDRNGKLVFGAGNICNHYFTREFLEDTVLPGMADMYHIAHKKIPVADGPAGETTMPGSSNGIKLESFIFDVFPMSRNMVLFEAPREDEFAPVKNAPGSKTDSPDTAREMISAQAQKWVQEAGGRLGRGHGLCEISPLVSFGGEGLKERVTRKKLDVPFHIHD